MAHSWETKRKKKKSKMSYGCWKDGASDLKKSDFFLHSFFSSSSYLVYNKPGAGLTGNRTLLVMEDESCSVTRNRQSSSSPAPRASFYPEILKTRAKGQSWLVANCRCWKREENNLWWNQNKRKLITLLSIDDADLKQPSRVNGSLRNSVAARFARLNQLLVSMKV